MNCVIELYSCFQRRLTQKTPILIKKLEVTFACKTVRPYSKPPDMEELFDPPPGIRGMKKLDKNAFKQTVKVPCVTGEMSNLQQTQAVLKKFFLKIMYLNPLQKLENNIFKLLLNPKEISSWDDLNKKTEGNLKSLNISEANFSQVPVDLGFENWSAESALKAILPKDTCLTSYSLIGHIIHLNIKENLLDYKHVIAEILLDKVNTCKTVIFKKNSIDNVYRNFEMEVLCGEPNFIATVHENKCCYELDFSKVYWNPRLSTEHMRIVEKVGMKDVLFDVFAGIGPFAIPAAKKKCLVFANDLNPESYKWLNHNIKLNKAVKDYIFTFNKDGKDFILEDIRENLIKTFEDDLFAYKIHVVMNLPAAAPTFIKYFNKLIKKSDLVNVDIDKVKQCLPIVNCYFFSWENECKKTVFEEASQVDLNNFEHSFHFVRQVSNGKNMFRVTFTLPYEYLVREDEVERVDSSGEPLPKRICTS